MSPLRVFVVDDHPVVTHGVRALLTGAEMEVVGTATGLEQAMEALRQVRADVVVVDLHLGHGPVTGGIAVIEALAGLHPVPRPLVYSMREDVDAIGRSLAAGALGYVTKAEAWQTLATAIRIVAGGGRYLSPMASRAMGRAAGADPPQELSARERDVFRLLGEGFGVTEIGERLDLSGRTVESYCGRLIVKLHLAGMRELRRSAIAARGS